MLCLSLWMYLLTHHFLGQMMIAMACGLQNSMVATYHGTVIRTTHLTGITSDLGATVGNWLVGRRVSLRKIILHSSLWWGFFYGQYFSCTFIQLHRIFIDDFANYDHFDCRFILSSNGQIIYSNIETCTPKTDPKSTKKNAAQSLIIPNYPLKTCQNRLACFKDLSYLVICPNLA